MLCFRLEEQLSSDLDLWFRTFEICLPLTPETSAHCPTVDTDQYQNHPFIMLVASYIFFARDKCEWKKNPLDARHPTAVSNTVIASAFGKRSQSPNTSLLCNWSVRRPWHKVNYCCHMASTRMDWTLPVTSVFCLVRQGLKIKIWLQILLAQKASSKHDDFTKRKLENRILAKTTNNNTGITQVKHALTDNAHNFSA